MKLDVNQIAKRLRARSALALTLESGRIAVSLLRTGESEALIAQSLSIPIGDQDVLRDPEKAGRELAAALNGAGIRERHCVVCLPPGWALTASSDLPEVAVEDLRGYLELRAEREFSISAGDFRLGYCEYALPDGKRRATLAALPSKKIEAVEQMLAAANRQGASISLALDHCFTQPPPKLHFLTNGNHVDVIVTAGGGVAGLRCLPGPSSTGEPAFDAAGFCREVRITLGRLPEPVRQQVRAAEFAGPSAMKLCAATRGGLSRMGLEVPDCADAPPEGSGAAADAARLFLRRKPVAFELVVPETKRWQTVLHRLDTAGRRKLLIAGAAVILLPVFLFIYRSETESHLQARWDSMQSTADELDGYQQKIRLFHPWFDSTPEALGMMESLAAAFPDENDVWAKSVQVGEGYKVSCIGFARTHPALLAFLDRMRKQPGITALEVEMIRGDNPIQFTLAFQWEPQHD